MSRAAAQLLKRIRDLERDVAGLRNRQHSHVRRGYAEMALAGLIEAGDTVPDALTPVSGNRQTVDSSLATLIEIVDESGAIKLKPIENASAANRAKATYWNVAANQPLTWSADAQPTVLARLRDGRWLRLPGCCGITCVPITDRVDSFPDLWPCWRALDSVGAYLDLDPSQWSTSGGLLKFVNAGGLFWQNWIIARAVALPVPFTMEATWVIDRFTTTKTFQVALAQGNTQFNGNGANWVGNSELLVGDPGAVSGTVTAWTGGPVFPAGSPVTLAYKVAVESGIMRHWVYIDGSLPTVTSGPAWGAAVTANTGGWASPPFSVERSWRMRPSAETDFADVELHTY